jgi:hypothetical protein
MTFAGEPRSESPSQADRGCECIWPSSCSEYLTALRAPVLPVTSTNTGKTKSLLDADIQAAIDCALIRALEALWEKSVTNLLEKGAGITRFHNCRVGVAASIAMIEREVRSVRPMDDVEALLGNIGDAP